MIQNRKNFRVCCNKVSPPRSPENGNAKRVAYENRQRYQLLAIAGIKYQGQSQWDGSVSDPAILQLSLACSQLRSLMKMLTISYHPLALHYILFIFQISAKQIKNKVYLRESRNRDTKVKKFSVKQFSRLCIKIFLADILTTKGLKMLLTLRSFTGEHMVGSFTLLLACLWHSLRTEKDFP